MSATTVTLSELCDLVSVQVDPASMPNASYLGLEHLEPGSLQPTGFGRADDVASQKTLFAPDDVLYSKLRPYLDKAVLSDREGVATTELLVLRPRHDTNPAFLACIVHSPQFIEHAMQGVTGAQHPRTSWAHIKTFEVPMLDVAKQTSVATVLWGLFNLGTATAKAMETASALKKTAMQQLFTRGLHGEAQKETEIGPIPESWSVCRLDEHADVLSTRMSYTKLRDLMPSAEENAVRVLGIKVSDMNTRGNEVELVDAALEVSVDLDVATAQCAPPGAIIFPKRGAAIATNKKRIAPTWTVFDPNIIGVNAREGLGQRFLFHWFQAFDLRTITEPGPTPQLNKKNLEPLLIPLPPSTEEQNEIVEVLDILDRKIEMHRRKRLLLDQLFRCLLHRLMTGEVLVEDIDLSTLLVAEGRAA